MIKLDFNTLRDNCTHQGAIKEGIKLCSFKDGQRARCWDDWQECKQKNCPLINKSKVAKTQDNDQLTIFDLLQEG